MNKQCLIKIKKYMSGSFWAAGMLLLSFLVNYPANIFGQGMERGDATISNRSDQEKGVSRAGPAIQGVIKERLMALQFNVSGGFDVAGDKRALAESFSSILKKVSFYNILVRSSLPYQRVIFAIDENFQAFVMPEEIDRVLSDELWGELTKEKVAQLAGLYANVSAFPPHLFKVIQTPSEIPYVKKRGISPLQYKKAIHKPMVKRIADGFIVEFLVWSNVGGYLESWKLSVTGSRKVKKEIRILGQGVGDFEVEQ
jgi:hypothetical protein